MNTKLKANLEAAIDTLAKRITSHIDASDALKYTQAALNAAHTISVISSYNNENLDTKKDR